MRRRFGLFLCQRLLAGVGDPPDELFVASQNPLGAQPKQRLTQPGQPSDRRLPATDAVAFQNHYCTFAVTDALAFSVNVHVLVLLPLLEQAPDQIASRPFETLSVMDVPVANDADPVLPTATLTPEGVELTVSPLRPLALSVSVAVSVGGGVLDGVTSNAAAFVIPPPDTEMVTDVSTETDDVKTLKPPRVVPAGTIMPFGTDAKAGLLLVT